MTETYVLGVDGGGTKTLAVVADREGKVVGVGRSGTTNFQVVGKVGATKEMGKAIQNALKDANISPKEVVCSAYGISGADREKDFDTVAECVEPNDPASESLLCNDTTLALKAGAPDLLGVAMISGTGSNCIGFNKAGEQVKVGGLGEFSGDAGSASDIGEQGLIAGMRALDGRNPPTALVEMYEKALEVEHLYDVFEFYYPDSYRPVRPGDYAPLVFKAAQMGDKVALKILQDAAKHQAHTALTACKRLYKKNDAFSLVFGGTIFQKAKPAIQVEMISERVQKRYPNVKIVTLRDEPVLGALWFALDLLHDGEAPRKLLQDSRRSLRAYMKQAG